MSIENYGTLLFNVKCQNGFTVKYNSIVLYEGPA